MGYAVYEDWNARDWSVQRWAGYGVPAVCDFPECATAIDRGLAYKCEEYSEYEFDDVSEEEVEYVLEGCGLFFCMNHLSHLDHGNATPKPDTAEWNDHLLTDESWEQWRDENPDRVAKLLFWR